MGLCGGSSSSMSTSIISTQSCVVCTAVCLGPGGVDGILASASPSLSEHKDGVVMSVPFDNEQWFAGDGPAKKFERMEEEEDTCVLEDEDVLVSDWT